MNKLVERFIRYAKKDTRSNPDSNTVPSSSNQTEFLKDLEKELKDLGFAEVKINEKNSFLTAKVPSTTNKKVATIGFIAHVDTADFNSVGVNPQVHENYNGEDILLNKEENIVLSPEEFPNLKNYIGKTLITTDGTTLLGADDKAGIAEIVTALSYLLEHKEIEHGDIKLAFGPDEEIGRGADLFDVEDFGCDFAYTLDGSVLGELEYESFNAARAIITIQGKNVHPGTAKDTMVNSMSIALDIQNAMPKYSVPEHTQEKEGFIHLTEISGTVEETKLDYIIRDHDRKLFEDKKIYIKKLVETVNKSLDKERISLNMYDEYYNMGEVIEKDFRSVEYAKEAMSNLGITPIIKAIRGGTDGSKISFMGIPTPNLFTGGENYHGRYEFACVEVMEKAKDLIIEIVKVNATKDI